MLHTHSNKYEIKALYLENNLYIGE